MNTTVPSIAAIAVLGAGLSFLAVPQSSQPAGGNSSSAVKIAAELGLAPDALAIAGITTPADVNGMLDRIAGASEEQNTYQGAIEAFDAAAEAMTEHSSLILIDSADEQVISAYSEAVAALDAAKQAMKDARESLFDVAVDGFSSASIQTLNVWRVSAHRPVPAEFRAVLRTDEVWKAIRSALRAQERATQTGGSLAGVHAEVLNDMNSDVGVVAAAYNLGAYLDQVAAIFETYLEE